MENDVNITSTSIVNSFWWKFLERFFSQGINLVVQIVLARILLPEEFGSLAIIAAITNYAAIFVQTGLGTALIQKKNLDKLDVSTLLSASLVVALFFYIILFLCAPFIANVYNAPSLVWPLRVLSLTLFLNAINSIQTAILSRKMKFKQLFIRSTFAIPIAGAAGIAMAYMGFGIWALVAHSILNILVSVIFMSFGADFKYDFHFSWPRAKALYSFSIKILLTSLVSGLHDTVRTMAIGKRYATSQLAYYDKGYSYSYYVTNIVSSVLSGVLLPTFSRSQDDIGKLKAMACKSCRLTAFVMFPVLFSVIAMAKPLILLLLTEKWAACIPFLMIFCILRLPGCLMVIDKQVYYAMGNSSINFKYEIALFAANVSVLFIMLSKGIMAIAIGATLVEMLGAFVLMLVSRKFYNYTLRERFSDLIYPFINSIVTAGVLSLLTLVIKDNLLLLCLQLIAGIAIYLLLSFIDNRSNLNVIIGIGRNFFKRK